MTALGQPDRLVGRPVSPRAFRQLGVEAVVLGAATVQDGLVRREGVAVWRRLRDHAVVFDRVAATSPGGAVDGAADLLAVRVVVVTTASRQRGLRTPAVGGRAARVLEAGAGEPDELPPQPGWLLLVDEGPGETWLYLAEEPDPAAAVRGFVGRRGRTDFARARRRTRFTGWGGAAVAAGVALGVSSPAVELGGAGWLAGGSLVALGLGLLVGGRGR